MVVVERAVIFESWIPKESTKKLSKLINESSEVQEYKINI